MPDQPPAPPKGRPQPFQPKTERGKAILAGAGSVKSEALSRITDIIYGSHAAYLQVITALIAENERLQDDEGGDEEGPPLNRAARRKAARAEKKAAKKSKSLNLQKQEDRQVE